MSLLPLNTLSEAGCLFIEARVLGNPGHVISQIGLTMDAPNTSIAVFSRTSGVLLVAGVGSFFAYRVATNFLHNRIFWECMETRHFDRIPTADRRLLYSFNVEEDEEENKEEEQEQGVTKSENDEQKSGKDDDSRSIRSFSMSQHSLSRLNRVRKSTKQLRGLLGSLNEKPTSRNAGILSRQSSRSIKSATSNLSIVSASSTKSASLRIVWEGSQPTWDDSDMIAGTSTNSIVQRVPPTVLSRLGHVASTSSLRNVEGSVGDLCSVFNDVMSVTSMVEEDYLPDVDEEEPETSEGIWQKCQVDNNKYMYQSFADETESEKESPGSRIYNGHPKHPEEHQDVEDLLTPQDPMIRSNNSKRSRSMYDSAIGGEISSEEGSTCPTRLYALMEGDNLSIIAPSCASLEWCDDLDRQNHRLDWDYEEEEVEEEEYRVASSSLIEINSQYAPKSSRDLMVMACEMFQPYSPPFKQIQNLYHKHRLKRIGLINPSNSSESLFSLFIRSCLYHKCSLLRDVSWSSLSKRLENAILECDFMRKWPGLSMETMRQELKQLFDLSSNSCSTISDSHTRAFEVMLVLEAKRAYDERLAGLFCGDWFNVDSPRDVMTNLTEPGRYLEPTLMWNLISRISAVSIDLLDCRQLSEAPEVYRFSSSKNSPTITWLQLGATSPLPLFYIPDDIE